MTTGLHFAGEARARLEDIATLLFNSEPIQAVEGEGESGSTNSLRLHQVTGTR